jgi:hypothetical protein
MRRRSGDAGLLAQGVGGISWFSLRPAYGIRATGIILAYNRSGRKPALAKSLSGPNIRR